jgi:hypothetical protein
MCVFSESSDMVSRVGGDFKETLRVSGGLDNIFDVMIDCHSTLEVRCLCFIFFVNVFYCKLSFDKSFMNNTHNVIAVFLQC